MSWLLLDFNWVRLSQPSRGLGNELLEWGAAVSKEFCAFKGCDRHLYYLVRQWRKDALTSVLLLSTLYSLLCVNSESSLTDGYARSFHTHCILNVNVYANIVHCNEFSLRSGSGTKWFCEFEFFTQKKLLDWLNWLTVVKNVSVLV